MCTFASLGLSLRLLNCLCPSLSLVSTLAFRFACLGLSIRVLICFFFGLSLRVLSCLCLGLSFRVPNWPSCLCRGLIRILTYEAVRRDTSVANQLGIIDKA